MLTEMQVGWKKVSRRGQDALYPDAIVDPMRRERFPSCPMPTTRISRASGGVH